LNREHYCTHTYTYTTQDVCRFRSI